MCPINSNTITWKCLCVCVCLHVGVCMQACIIVSRVPVSVYQCVFFLFFVGLGTYFCYKSVIQWPVCIYVIIRLKMIKSYRETHKILLTGPAVRTEPYQRWGKNKTWPITAKHIAALLGVNQGRRLSVCALITSKRLGSHHDILPCVVLRSFRQTFTLKHSMIFRHAWKHPLTRGGVSLIAL